MVAKEIYDRISELIIACEVIRNAERCDRCPLKDDCLEDCTFEHIAYKVKVDGIEKMMDMADRITEIEEERSVTEAERRWEHEADEWLLRKAELNDE